MIRRSLWDVKTFSSGDGVPADTIRDWIPQENSVSVYLIDTAGTETADVDQLVRRVVRALAATRDFPSHLDFLLFPCTLLTELGISAEKIPGETPDEVVNAIHRDLDQLTVSQLAALIGRIFDPRIGIRDRIQKRIVQTMLRDGLDAGQLSRTRMNQSLLARLDTR